MNIRRYYEKVEIYREDCPSVSSKEIFIKYAYNA